MLDLEEARKRILDRIGRLGAEDIPLVDAAGRFLAEDVNAPCALPPFDNSAMDGYAVRAADLAAAAQGHPVILNLVGTIPAGQAPSVEIAARSCARIFTGSVLPRGADAVVMQEDVLPGAQPNQVRFIEPVRPWENIRFSGEDVKAQDPVGKAGQRISAGQSGLFAALGMAAIKAASCPKVGLIATGSELKEAGVTLGEGEIFESNRIALSSLVKSANGIPRLYPIVNDTLPEIRAAIESALLDCDILITTGGASVGELDFVKDAFLASGGTVDFWRVAIKPGKPFMFGVREGKALFGLPGNPISAFVTFLLLVRPALLKMQGALNIDLARQKGVLAEGLANEGNRRHFMRVFVDSSGGVTPAGGQASHLLGSLAGANGLVDVPAETSLDAGTEVETLRWF